LTDGLVGASYVVVRCLKTLFTVVEVVEHLLGLVASRMQALDCVVQAMFFKGLEVPRKR